MSETSIVKINGSHTLWIALLLMDNRKTKLSQFLTCSSIMLLHVESTNTLPFILGFYTNLPSRTLGKLSFFQSLLEGLREHHGLLEATPPLQSVLVLKHNYIFGSETKLSTVTFPWQYNGLQTLSIQRVK